MKEEDEMLPSCARFSAGSHRYFSDIDMLEYFHPPALQGYLLRPGSTLDRQRFSFSYFQTSHLLELLPSMEHKGVVFFLVPEITLIHHFTDPFIPIWTFFYHRRRRD